MVAVVFGNGEARLKEHAVKNEAARRADENSVATSLLPAAGD
jgi:hypothetical protein